MRVRIVCYEDVNGWILGKFARKLQEELLLLSVDADIARTPDPVADVNHHVIYIDFKGPRSRLDTVMITHIDADWKFRKLKGQISDGVVGICMSSDSMLRLASAGLPVDRLCYINPAHDGEVSPRPLKIGIATRLYPDGRKREQFLARLSEKLNPADLSFQIMGEGWEDIVAGLVRRGFSVQHTAAFDREIYLAMIPSLDYYLYLGCDEGSMGFVDALAAGVPTIATPQGFHLDAVGGLVHSFETEEELYAIFKNISMARRILIDSVASWTWSDYAKKHVEVWNYLLTGEPPPSISYPDGVASLLDSVGGTGKMAQRIGARLGFLGGSVRGIRSSLRTRFSV